MSARPRGKGLRHVSDIITDVLEADPPLPPSPAHDIGPCLSWHCSHPDCMRMYLRSVEKKGDAA